MNSHNHRNFCQNHANTEDIRLVSLSNLYTFLLPMIATGPARKLVASYSFIVATRGGEAKNQSRIVS